MDDYGVWSFALDFSRKARRIEEEETVFLTDGRYTLVCSKRSPKTLKGDEATRFVNSLKVERFLVYKDGLRWMDKGELLREIGRGDEVVVSEFGEVFFGRPLVAITFRPAKVNERFRLFGNVVRRRVKCDYESIGILTVPEVITVVDRRFNALYLPGGTKEEGEDDVETIRRELREELNLRLKDVSEDCIETTVYSPKRKGYVRVKTYVGTVSGELKVKADEISAVLIFRFEDLKEDLIKWLNERYLLGPNVVDVAVVKRGQVERIASRFISS